MAGWAALRQHLREWAGKDPRKAGIADTILRIAGAGIGIADILAQGPLAGDLARKRDDHEDGDTQKELDFIAHQTLKKALAEAPVACMGSEEAKEAIALNANGLLAVNIDPLDGSSNIDANLSIGTIFSILPAEGRSPLLQPGRNQLAAGFIIYGPQTAMVLTLGHGTQMFWRVPGTDEFLLARANVQITSATQEYAINSSNFRFWDDAIKAYVLDCKLGADGPRKKNFNIRWHASLVAEAFRILMRGGIYLYPGDNRPGYANGRLRLLYEANPLAFIIEQAGGACTDGRERILDIEPTSLHQRVPLVFGCKKEVEEVAHYYREPHSLGNRSPLFRQRGLFRSMET